MRLGELGELGLIARVRATSAGHRDRVVCGIGDDAAVFRTAADLVQVVTTDMLVDGVHFRWQRADPYALGCKAMTVNLSDLAAMGAEPRFAFVAFAAPGSLAAADCLRLFEGMTDEAARYGVHILGGDTTRSPTGVVISITLIGEGRERSLVYRSGAHVGDIVFVDGNLGDSAAGLLLLERGLPIDDDDRRALVAAHNGPRAMVAEGRFLAESGLVGAMIDLSDGLATDLRHVLEASGGDAGSLGACLELTRLPISPSLANVAEALAVDPVAVALTGGEDYCLLATVAPARWDELCAHYRARFGRPPTQIGTVEAEPGLRVDGRGGRRAYTGRGFEHFRRP